VTEKFNLDTLRSHLGTQFVGHALSYKERVGSTFDLAREEAERGAPDGAVVLAEEQTSGRGRLGRSWVSPPGVNIYATVIFRPSLDELRYLSVITPLAVAEGIEQITGLYTRIKWPNDVLVNGKKVCGVLPLAELTDDDVAYALVGIGVNVNLDVGDYPEIADIATSLKAEAGREISREELLARILERLEDLYLAVRRDEVVSVEWKRRLHTLGQHVRIQAGGGEEIAGVAVDADSDGSLILRRDDGAHIRVEAGEVLLR
jgi:BirA family biotin operon repressor/biotin-[acetyl-CoA-carboxylase] ligase